MIFSLLFLNLVVLVIAGADNELHVRDGHAHEKRAHPQVPLMSPQVMITPPDRELVWGDFNVIQTTDIHGWLHGHQKLSVPEPNYSGNLGEFASFVTHMKNIAMDGNHDADLLLVDSGDVHDGTGLSEGFPLGGVDGHNLTQILRRLPYDLMTIGNHELNGYDKTFDMYTNFVPYLNGYYLSSNANLTILDATGHNVSVPIGKRYAKFRTRKGRLVTSLGVFRDWIGVKNTSVEFVDKMVGEQWFVEAIAEEPDVFVLIGHMELTHGNWTIVVDPIRKKYPDTPILIFGGHSHIRDCQEYDEGRTIALQSGRYMETIGWLSTNISAAKKYPKEKLPYTRRYLDQNRVTYVFHTTKLDSTFDTSEGISITKDLQALESDFNLNYVYGKAPKDYTMCQHEYPDEQNVFRLFVAKAAPYVLRYKANNQRANIFNIIIISDGLLRYDIFNGNFTKNDALTASPYADKFSYIPDVPTCLAKPLLAGLNKDAEKAENACTPQKADPPNYTPGYVTTDGCGNDGDDTRHSKLNSYLLPHYMSSDPPILSATGIDFVFLDYFRTKLLKALNGIPDMPGCQRPKNYTDKDVQGYTDMTTDRVLPIYAEAGWPLKP